MFLSIKTWTAALSAVFFIAPVFAHGQVIINEIMYDLEGSDAGLEWIELYNDGPQEIDLTGWKFNDGDNETNHGLNTPPKNGSRGSLLLPPGGYLLLASDASALAASLAAYSGSIIDTVMSLSNTAGSLKIISQDGSEMTAAAYNKEIGANGNGKTLEWDGSSFKESVILGGSPGGQNGSAATGSPVPAPNNEEEENSTLTMTAPAYKNFSNQIFLQEFMPWPEAGHEWVELISKDKEAVDLSDWQIDDEAEESAGQKIGTGILIQPGQLLVIELGKNILNNEGDSARLLWPDGQAVHAVSFQKAVQGKSCSRFEEKWLWASPTPGLENKKTPPTPKTASEPKALVETLQQSVSSEADVENTVQKPAAEPEIKKASAAIVSNFSQPAAATGRKSPSPMRLAGLLILASLAGLSFIFWKRRQGN